MNAFRTRQKEPVERRIEDGDVITRTGEDGAQPRSNRAFVGKAHDIQRAQCVNQFGSADAESVLDPQQRTERSEIFGQAAEWKHQERGVEIVPNPKSFSRL